MDYGDHVLVAIEYDIQIFDAVTIAQLSAQLAVFLVSSAQIPDARLAAFVRQLDPPRALPRSLYIHSGSARY